MISGRCAGLVFAATLAAAGLAADPAGASFKYLKPGMEAADFSLRTLDEREITLAELKRNRATLLVFWATWSPRSEPALREAQALSERHGGDGLKVVAVNLNRQDVGVQERALIEKTARDLGLTVAVALDPGFAASAAIGVVANPALALLDARGVLLWDASGWSRTVREELVVQVEGALGVRAAPAAPVTARGHVPEHKALLNFNLGRTFLRQGNEARAQALFEAAATLDPAWAAPRTTLGHLLLQRGGEREARQAEELFRAAVAIDPADVSAQSGLGETLLLRGSDAEAEKVLGQAQTLDGTFTPAVVGHALALARLGRTGEAVALFDAALELHPRDAKVFAGRAACREAAGTLDAAAADYRQAVEILLGVR